MPCKRRLEYKNRGLVRVKNGQAKRSFFYGMMAGIKFIIFGPSEELSLDLWITENTPILDAIVAREGKTHQM